MSIWLFDITNLNDWLYQITKIIDLHLARKGYSAPGTR